MARILIVDDSAVMRLNLRQIFTEAGHEVVAEAPNGKVALSMYEKFSPDIVTMDITMPVMSGVDATGIIVSKFPDAKIIMISALNQKKMVYDALRKGARHYVIKPIDKEKVMSVVNEVLLVKGETEEQHEEVDENVVIEETVKEKEHVEHFQIENADGVFVVSINNQFTDKDMENMDTAMQGMMFIKPLRLKIDFGTLEEFDDGYLNRIMVYGKKAVESGGEYHVEATSSELKSVLTHKEEIYLK